MWPLATYSEIVSTMTFLVSRTRLILRYVCVLLYHYTINNDYSYIAAIICAVPGF